MPEAVTFDGCEILRKLSSGPVCDLYRAIQEPLGRTVLIKALGHNILPSSPFASTLEREARLLSELDHPGIVKVHDFVKRGDRMWLVLEHVDGVTLEELLGRAKRLNDAAAVAIGLRLAEALAHAHEHSVVHRDLSPKNVFISKRGEIKLLNFALAVDERMPTAPELLDGGTGYLGPVYMSPEQILGEPADPRSDLFSLGVMLYELLSGTRPFEGPNERSTSLRIRQNPPPPLTQGGVKVSGSVERVIARCLEKLPSDRIGSAHELASELRHALAETWDGAPEQAILAALSSAGLVEVKTAPPKQTLRVVRRTSVASVALGLFLIGLGVVASGYALRRAFGPMEASRRAAAPLSTPGAEASELRVVAHPWAYVFVDGQQRETTPFARPIRLSPGTHYIRLEHPNAVAERRTVTMAAGESVLLEVDMKVVAPSGSAPTPNPSASAELASP
ncbi:MAG TPA: serine/threonine-protein kinase [Polyangiaceae bacterium]|nr:serine/threonine-protein kinase [Polyangiaceae bacterium]